eukprot:g4882.t1
MATGAISSADERFFTPRSTGARGNYCSSEDEREERYYAATTSSAQYTQRSWTSDAEYATPRELSYGSASDTDGYQHDWTSSSSSRRGMTPVLPMPFVAGQTQTDVNSFQHQQNQSQAVFPPAIQLQQQYHQQRPIAQQQQHYLHPQVRAHRTNAGRMVQQPRLSAQQQLQQSQQLQVQRQMVQQHLQQQQQQQQQQLPLPPSSSHVQNSQHFQQHHHEVTTIETSDEAAGLAAAMALATVSSSTTSEVFTKSTNSTIGTTSDKNSQNQPSLDGGDGGHDASSLADIEDEDIKNVFSYARHNRCKDLDALLQKGIPVNVRDRYGNTLLIVACQNGLKRVAKLALRKGADINARNYKGNTCLHFCWAFGYGETLGQYLISKGADSSLRNVENLTCFEGIANIEPLRINGLVAATFTPFSADLSLNITKIEEDASFLHSTGVNNVFVCGTTGESLSLQLEERKRITEEWVRVAQYYDLKVIVHVGANAVGDAIELAAHAAKVGAHAIAAMPPTFFKPATVDALALTISTIFNAAPKLPAYYYHIPSMTGSKFLMLDLIQSMEKLSLAKNFVGIKYTGLYEPGAFGDLQKCMRYGNGKYEVLSGRDEMTVEALSIGVLGFVGSQYNFAAEIYNEIHNLFHQKSVSVHNQVSMVDLQFAALDLLSIWQSAPSGTNGCKYLKLLSGVNVGDSRLPFIPLQRTTQLNLSNLMRNWCEKPIGKKLANGTQKKNGDFLKWCHRIRWEEI